MPHLTTDDDVTLYYEEGGSGIPVVFVHEFAGDYRTWESQVRYFARCYRCIAYNARGYPPSDVPADGKHYSQDRARDDIRAVLDALKIDKAHIVGLSMGGFAALHFGFTYPHRARSLVVAGCGYGTAPDKRQQPRRPHHANRREGLGPQVQDPQQHRGTLEPPDQDRRQAGRDGRRLEDEDRIERLAAQAPCAK